LDPHSRNELWTLLREHVRRGTTLILTTQYLEEADRLADDIVVLDHGRVAAHGTPAALKARLGGERVVVTLVDAGQLGAAREALATFAGGEPSIDAAAAQVVVPTRGGTRLVQIVRALEAAGIDAHDVHRREVTLDDVFLSLTRGGASAAEAA
jgi:ABC-2 type transport system ATP-binding protein